MHPHWVSEARRFVDVHLDPAATARDFRRNPSQRGRRHASVVRVPLYQMRQKDLEFSRAIPVLRA